MEAFYAFLDEVKKFLGPKFAPVMLALTAFGLLLHPIGKWQEFQSNQKAIAQDYTRLESHMMKMDAETLEYRKADLKFKQKLALDVARIQGYLKLHSKEE